MKILFNAFINPKTQSGVEKKIFGQIKALQRLGNQVWYFAFENGFIVLNNEQEKTKLFAVKDNMIAYYLALEKAARIVSKDIDFDLCYIRRIFCSPFHLKTLSILKKRKVKIVEEIPTYPYDEENKSYTDISYKLAAILDKATRNKLCKYLDYISTYSNDKTIFNLPCINLENGIDFDNLRFSACEFKENEINLIAVSAMSPWHGYERLIKGLKNYYCTKQDIKVVLHMVGSGQEQSKWEQLTKDYNLQDYVIFYGHKSGTQLSDIFDKCQIGVGSLGGYKKNITMASELKIREYCFLGKPFVYTLDFPNQEIENNKFCLKLSNDDSVINIDTIVEFYKRVEKIENLAEKMNAFAKQNYSWDAQMQLVLNKITQ